MDTPIKIYKIELAHYMNLDIGAIQYRDTIYNKYLQKLNSNRKQVYMKVRNEVCELSQN